MPREPRPISVTSAGTSGLSFSGAGLDNASREAFIQHLRTTRPATRGMSFQNFFGTDGGVSVNDLQRATPNPVQEVTLNTAPSAVPIQSSEYNLAFDELYEDSDDNNEDDSDWEDEDDEAPPLTRRNQEGDPMATIGQIFGRNQDVSSVVTHPLVVGSGRVGVELEVENFPNPPRRLRYWNLHDDGSLRNNGIEFVFKGPLGGQDIFSAITELDSVMFSNKPDLNIRCSTHVHVDVRDMTVDQVKRFIIAYAFFETFLFRQSGFYRLKSNFCVPLSVAEGMVEILARYWNNRSQSDFISYIQNSWDKYCAINLIPMAHFGSIEFRMSEAKSRKGQLLRLVNRFLALRELAIESTLDSTDFIRHIQTLDPKQVFRKGLSRSAESEESDFKTGWMIANDIINRSKL